jgi:hypothetical protein
MSAMQFAMLGLAISMASSACPAQGVAIPFGQIERDAKLEASLRAPDSETSASTSSSSIFPGVASPTPFVAGVERGPAAPVAPRILDSKFYTLNGLHLGMAVFDVGMTQHCIAVHQCREGNPLMPSSLAGQLSMDFAFVGYSSFVSYRLKKHRSSMWWLSPTVGAAAHAVGVTTGIAHY